MKPSLKSLISISIALFALNCAHDENVLQKSNIQFGVTVKTKSSDGGRLASIALPDSAYVSLSVETTSGVSIYSFKHIEIIKLGDDYITAPLALVAGNYRLTDFMILSKKGEVLYATPKEGSMLAPLVDDPLPANFAITKDGILNMNVQVVSINQQLPEDFGYVSFGVKVVESDFSISVFTMENDHMALTSGSLLLYKNNQLIYTQNLLSKVNPIEFHGEPDARYALVIEKKGFTVRARDFTLKDLVHELAGQPLAFMLEPALTITTIHHAIFDTNLPMTFQLDGNGVPNSHFRYVVDWGDGTIEPHDGIYGADGHTSFFTLHFYADSLAGKSDHINITGNVDDMSWFLFPNPVPLSIKKIDLTHLPNLSLFGWFGNPPIKNDTPTDIDFSKNTKLTDLLLTNFNLDSLDITNNPFLHRLFIDGTNLSDGNVNEVIQTLHNHATGNHITNGLFSFNDGPFITPDAKLELIDLRDHFGWQIYPDPQ